MLAGQNKNCLLIHIQCRLPNLCLLIIEKSFSHKATIGIITNNKTNFHKCIGSYFNIMHEKNRILFQHKYSLKFPKKIMSFLIIYMAPDKVGSKDNFEIIIISQ